jgi:hypothetical protein
MSNSGPLQKSAKKRSFGLLVSVPQLENTPKKIRAAQKSAVLTTSQHAQALGVKFSTELQSGVQLLEPRMNSETAECFHPKVLKSLKLKVGLHRTPKHVPGSLVCVGH